MTQRDSKGVPIVDGVATRPSIPTTDVPLYEAVEASWHALMAANGDERQPRVLVRGTELVTVGGDGALNPLTQATLRVRLSEVARYYRPSRGGETEVDPPVNVVNAIREADVSLYAGAPRVDRIVTTPVFAADRTLITEPGWHPSGVYYSPAPGLEGLDVPADPIMEEMQLALHLLREELLGEFAFVSEADRVNALSLVLLPFVRDMIPGPTPLHAIYAPRPGEGKSLLAEVCLIPALGEVPQVGEGESDAEWRKALTTYLVAGKGALLIDNVDRHLDSAALSRALTAGVWRDRILGKTQEVEVPVRAVFVATLNTPSMSMQNARRCLPIGLDSGEEHPEERKNWRHADLKAWAQENRRQLAWAALTIAQHWVRAGADEDRGAAVGTLVRGSYEAHSRTVGGILSQAGHGEFWSNWRRFADEAVSDDDDLGPFLRAWREHLPEPVTARELEELVAPLGALRGSAPASLRSIRDDQLVAKLPYWLRERRDRVAGGHKLVNVGQGADNRRRWTVETTSD